MVSYYRAIKSRTRVETSKDPFQILTLLCRFSLESKIKVADVRRDERKCKFTFILEGYNISSVLHFLLFSTYCERNIQLLLALIQIRKKQNILEIFHFLSSLDPGPRSGPGRVPGLLQLRSSKSKLKGQRPGPGLYIIFGLPPTTTKLFLGH